MLITLKRPLFIGVFINDIFASLILNKKNMKKIALTIATIFAFGVVNAQTSNEGGYKPTKGTVSTEVGLTGGLNNAAFNLNTGVLKFRYFLKDDLGLRLGFANNSTKTEESDNTVPANIETTINKYGNFEINLGIEKHFAGSDRLSTYAGADLLIGFGNASTEVSDQSGSSISVDGANISGGGSLVNRASNGFGVRLLTGADYYIAKKLFLGVEAGLNIVSSKLKEVSVTNKVGSVSTTTTTPEAKGSGFNTNVIGGIRIGYQF